jgi:hypothetical protein
MGSDPDVALYGDRMTERRGDQGFTVAPQRLGDERGGPGRARLRRIGFALVLAVAAAIFTIGWLGPRLSDRPNLEISYFATATPGPSASASATPTPLSTTFATPLPSITRPDGPVSSGQIAIATDAFHLLDLATGEISAGPPVTIWRDAIVGAATGGGWTCICLGDALDSGASSVPIRMVGIGSTGTATDSTDVAVLRNSSVNGQSTLTTDIDMFDGGRRGLLAVANRNGESWRFTVSSIDVAGRRLGSSVLLGKVAAPPPRPVPSPRPSLDPSIPDQDELYLDGPHLRVAPDGRVAFVWGTFQRFNPSNGDQPVTKVHAWRVALGADGSIQKVTAAPGLLTLPPYCSLIAFASADRLAWLCPYQADPAAGFDGTWQFGALDLDGRRAGTSELKLGMDGYIGQPLFDRANGMAYLWDATGLSIARFDVHAMTAEQIRFDPLARSSTGLAPAGGSAPVDWHGVDSAVRQTAFTNVTGGLNGDYLFGIGFDPVSTTDSGSLPSRGIFVIDRATLALVNRWAPAANYLAVTALPGGLVAAAGMPGIEADGQYAPWESSLTIYDEADGRIVVRFGRLGSDNPALVIDR